MGLDAEGSSTISFEELRKGALAMGCAEAGGPGGGVVSRALWDDVSVEGEGNRLYKSGC
jgi:hypothetical protein